MASPFAFRLPSLILCAGISLAAGSAHAVSIAPGDILVSGTTSTGQGIFRVDPQTGDQTPIASGAFVDFAVSGANTIYATEADSVVEISIATGMKSVVSSGSFGAIAVGASGRLFVSAADTVIEIDRSTGAQSLAFSGGFLDTGSLELDSNPMGDLIILNDDPFLSATQRVFGIDVETGQQTLLLSNGDGGADFFWTTGLFVAPDGDIFTADGFVGSTHVVQLDAQTGIASIIEQNSIFDGSVHEDLLWTDVAVDAAGNLLLVGTPVGGIEEGVFINNLTDENGAPFSPGMFNEIQVVAVPEPTLVILAIAGGALGAVVRRRPPDGAAA